MTPQEKNTISELQIIKNLESELEASKKELESLRGEVVAMRMSKEMAEDNLCHQMLQATLNACKNFNSKKNLIYSRKNSISK